MVSSMQRCDDRLFKARTRWRIDMHQSTSCIHSCFASPRFCHVLPENVWRQMHQHAYQGLSRNSASTNFFPVDWGYVRVAFHSRSIACESCPQMAVKFSPRRRHFPSNHPVNDLLRHRVQCPLSRGVDASMCNVTVQKNARPWSVVHLVFHLTQPGPTLPMPAKGSCM